MVLSYKSNGVECAMGWWCWAAHNIFLLHPLHTPVQNSLWASEPVFPEPFLLVAPLTANTMSGWPCNAPVHPCNADDGSQSPPDNKRACGKGQQKLKGMGAKAGADKQMGARVEDEEGGGAGGTHTTTL